MYVKNWRDFQPKIAHMSAVHWGGLRSQERDSDDERSENAVQQEKRPERIAE